MELKGKKALFLGDSITEGAGTSGPERVYHQLLKESACLSEAINYGISGTRFAKQHLPSSNLLVDRDFCERVDEMDDTADLIVVFGGTNDYGHGNAEIGAFTDRTKDTFYGACHELMTELINKYPDAQIVFMTPLHRKGEENPFGDCNQGTEKIYAPLKTYVEIIKEVAEYYSIPVLDLYATSGIQPNVPIICEKFCPDGLHPNDAGHVKIAQKLENFLKTL